ncbi:MAG: hypothetical protein WD431_17690 [Cyclobacteriaceae bacterium]
MDAIKSKLADELFQNPESNRQIMKLFQKGESIVGTEVEIMGEKYTISDGRNSNLDKSISDLRERINKLLNENAEK